MASGRSSRRYPLRGSENKGFRKAVGVSDSDQREGLKSANLDFDHLTGKRGGERLIPCRKSQRLQKKLKTEKESQNFIEHEDEGDFSVSEVSESETLDFDGEEMIPCRRSQRLQKKTKSEKASENFTEDDDEGSGGALKMISRRRSERLQEKNKADKELQNSFENDGDLDNTNFVASLSAVSISDEASSEYDATDDMSISDGPTCDICQIGVAGNLLIKCKISRCLRSYHIFCLDPPLNLIQEDWTCPFCGGDSKEGDKKISSRKIQSIIGHRRINLQDPKCAAQMQFLVKWDSLSHHHDSWVPMDWLYIFDRMRLNGYQKRYLLMKDTVVSFDPRKPEWLQIDRAIACSSRVEPANPCDISSQLLTDQNTSGFKFLVKWKGLDYCDTTWESEMTEELRGAIAKLTERHHRALGRDSDKEQGLNNKNIAESYKGVLYDYQIQGVQWILDNFQARRNVILADEMGLGKTVQVVCFLKSILREGLSTGPALVVAPKSILLQWEKEFGCWAESMNVVVYQGDQTSRKCIQAHEFYSFAKQPLFDVLVTSYEMVQLDASIMRKFNWSSIVIDEAHKIKNLYCKLFGCFKQYTSEFRLLLTGTPLQNSLLELFALLHFIDPIEFPDPESESKSFSGLQHSEAKISQIHDLLKPRMLRRMKSNVLREKLPTKKWVEVPCALTESQRELYIDILEKNHAKLHKKIQSGKKIALNWMLVSLKKCCNHPYLFPGQEECQSSDKLAFSSLVAASGKLQLLEKLLPKLKERGNRVIIFSQMTRMLDILEDFLSFLGFSYFRIDGQTRLSTRQQNMKEYNDPESDTFIFLMSTRAGGLGIDLPGADRVIIYDPDFNPFMDLQAQSRAHRIGQTRPVVVYQLITKGTVEEKILLKSKRKLAIENIVMNPSKKPSIDDLHSVLLHGAHAILNRKKIQATSIHYDEIAIDNLLKLDPVPGETCAPDENGYLGSIESFKNGHGENDELVVSPKKEEWKELLGPVNEAREEIGDFGRGKRVKRAVNYVFDEVSDNDGSSPECSRSASSDDDVVGDEDDEGDDDDDDDDSDGDDGYVVENVFQDDS